VAKKLTKSAGSAKLQRSGIKKSKTSTKKLSSSRAKKPRTMEELLAQTDHQLKGLKRGEVIDAVVVEKTKSVLYLDIGGKSEGMVIDREMKAAKDFIKDLQVGDAVKAVVTQAENDRGQTLLSLKKAALESSWGEFNQKLKTQEVVRVRGSQVNRGGLVVEYRGLQGFIPASQFGSKLEGRAEDLVGKDLQVKIIEVDQDKKRLIFSEKEVSDAGLLQAQKEALAKVKKGDEFKGEVTGVMPFGLFVKVKPTTEKVKKEAIFLEGLVHISEISWEKVEEPKQLYKEGDKVKVKVLAIDKDSGKLNLSIKQLVDDPWQGIEKRYQVDKKVKGEVVRLAPFGVFVKLGQGIEGLIHISKVPVEQVFKASDKVNCYIESIDSENRRISLGLVLTKKPVGYK